MAYGDWTPLLRSELAKPYGVELMRFVAAERAMHDVYPPSEDVFAALQATSHANTRVVILGQDPYHGPGQAHGLSFSVRPGVALPPSLRNVFVELRSDLGVDAGAGAGADVSGHLGSWASSGVLLLNAVLTVRAHSPASHRGQGWERLTDQIISAVSAKRERVVFLLWGAYARSKRDLIDDATHTVIEAPHPSPLSASRGFFGSKPFSRANDALIEADCDPVDWSL